VLKSAKSAMLDHMVAAGIDSLSAPASGKNASIFASGIVDPASVNRRRARCSIIACGMTFTFQAPYALSKSIMFTVGNQGQKNLQRTQKPEDARKAEFLSSNTAF
jgi:hypothetical protein